MTATATINNREFEVAETGLKNVPYRLTSGNLVLRGIRLQNNPTIIAAMQNSRVFGYFDQNTGAEMTVIPQ